ncbi:hypothetical protein AVEN_92890-1 [Araneus ventricosus]|uniref:Uncharacterized protein n=1 Tax=Araneus ventricosus TaxID=182803 RepID=A0A4Y2SS53_ARAVE|nr:hypothetical protein AVEN_201911-1 [Araneus ventricosus]GBN89794.1 hypothetical protein AVEN_37541-1 [Araneus ventricosus]GBN89795.1 hypothetical protein AVEN_65800-1 [Araneus ventricosus]GBN89804.1 hypothetical protein AVEN_92890-1 [Araneus ventricosus]
MIFFDIDKNPIIAKATKITEEKRQKKTQTSPRRGAFGAKITEREDRPLKRVMGNMSGKPGVVMLISLRKTRQKLNIYVREVTVACPPAHFLFID